MGRDWARTAGLIVVFALIVCLGLVMTVSGDEPQAVDAWTRTWEPVVLTGDQLPQFDGIPGDELFAYAYAGSAWQQIPLQFDEVYTVEDGLLDANDEVVFMAMDLGSQVGPSTWIADADSENHPRYEIKVSNPLNPAEQGWVYVYRSATLAPTHPDYVDWDGANERIVAGTYVLGFAPAVHPGLDSLELNGSGVDALDRSKIRINATCYVPPFPPITLTLTEEDLPQQSDVTPDVDGPVRVGGGDAENSAWSYHSLFQTGVVTDVDSFPPPEPCTSVDINWVRFSMDWLDPSASGMAPATYYDDNTPGGVAVDGAADAVAATPVNVWKQVSGGQGSLVQVADVALGGGTLSNYYEDNGAEDPDDTGDLKSFGDAGFRVDAPSGEVSLKLTVFVLDPAQPNVGATYRGYYDNPLQVATAAQTYDCRPTGVDLSWPPGVTVGVETAFTASVAGGETPFTYTWTFGDDGSVSLGNPVTHTFGLSGTFGVTLTVGNACGTAEPVVQQVAVFEPGAVHLVYLPLVLK